MDMEIKRKITDSIMSAIEHRISTWELDSREIINKSDLLRELERLRTFVKESKISLKTEAKIKKPSREALIKSQQKLKELYDREPSEELLKKLEEF